jgi:hypothetical protein
LWTLASNKILLHIFRCLFTVSKFLIPIFFKSSSSSSVHLFRDLPLFLLPSILAVTICFGILSLFNISDGHTILTLWRPALCLKIHSFPHSAHTPFPFHKPLGEYCAEKSSEWIIRNAWTNYAGATLGLGICNVVVYILTTGL